MQLAEEDVAVQPDAVQLGPVIGVRQVEHGAAGLGRRVQPVDPPPVRENWLKDAEVLEHREADRLHADAGTGAVELRLGRLLEELHAVTLAREEDGGGGAGGAEADDADVEAAESRPERRAAFEVPKSQSAVGERAL